MAQSEKYLCDACISLQSDPTAHGIVTLLSVTVSDGGNFTQSLPEVEIPSGVAFSSILKNVSNLSVDVRYSVVLSVRVGDKDNNYTVEANTTFSKCKTPISC